MRLGYIGLGKMGKNMVLRLLEHDIEVVAWNRSPEPLEEVVKVGAIGAENIPDLIEKLKGNVIPAEEPESSSGSRSKSGMTGDGVIIWLMLPAGGVTDQFIDEVLPLLSPGDLIVDGANSFYKDTLRRNEKITAKGVHFMDIGVSGGPGGARSGACMMIGGANEDFERIKEVVIAGSAPDAWGHFGKIGAGHFAKMVHNGIEYGMMQAIAEGAAILKFSDFEIDMPEVFRVYNNQSVIESRLVGWTLEVLKEDVDLKDTSSVIAASGEGEWTVKTAKEMGIEVPVIEDSFKVRQTSANDPENSPAGYRNKVVSAQRGKFGHHPVKKFK
jgi:6-phosphogluconate dehydrogenase